MEKVPYGYPPSGSSAYVAPPPQAHQHPYSVPPRAVQAPIPQYAQPQYRIPGPPPNSEAWTTGLCGCCNNCHDCGTCCVGCWCPCVLVGQSIEGIDEGATSCVLGGILFFLIEYLTGCGCLYTFIYRTRLRQKYGLPETPCPDFCVDFCCLSCSICQVYRELENRNGLTPAYATGYPVYAAAAPNQQHMSR
ncbi:hypothetical protein R1flu_011716 [Riccia fluitans]|uniref:Uncharacterized protein n=1 Tax=Riccia fluitans TaxID=41844 RepID=A0ABD1Z8K1_9MARC